MQSDSAIWDVVGKRFCCFKTSFNGVTLCRNPYNVSGLCSKTTCPLANGYYGTIIEEDGVCFLYIKTVERAHTPRTMWEKIRLSEDTSKAFAQIDQHMTNIYKDYQIQRCKRRLCKIREYLRRMQQAAAAPTKTYEYESRKVMKRETAREKNALRAAKLQTTVEQELVERLKAGHYGDIYNFSPAFTNLIENISEEEEDESISEDDAELEPDIEELA